MCPVKIAILKLTADRSDLKKITKSEILRIEEVSEDAYFSTLVEIGMEEITLQLQKDYGR